MYASIHKKLLFTIFPEMTLRQQGNGAFKAELTPYPDGIKARKANRFTTPVAYPQITREAVGLINSALILNLNEPCALASTRWIRPLKYIGVWWGMHLGIETWKMDERHGATTANAKKYIDFAAANQIQGVLFEGWNAGWESWVVHKILISPNRVPILTLMKSCATPRRKELSLSGITKQAETSRTTTPARQSDAVVCRS